MWAIGYLDVAALAWSARFADISVSAALYSASPLMFVLVAYWMFAGEGRYRRMGALDIGLFGVAIAGAVLAAASQGDGFGAFGIGDQSVIAPAVLIAGLARGEAFDAGVIWTGVAAGILAGGMGFVAR